MLLLVLIVQLLTVALLTSTERFYIEKQQLLQDTDFVQGNTYWHQKGEGVARFNGNLVSILNDDIADHAVYQNVPIDQPGHYSISFDAAIRDVKSPTNDLGGAEVVVVYRTAQGNTNGHGKRLFRAGGTKEIAPYNQITRFESNISSVDISVRLKNSSGQITVGNLVVSHLKEIPFYAAVKTALIALWALLFVGLVYVAVRVFSRLQVIALSTALALTLIGVLLPGSAITTMNGLIMFVLPTSLLAGLRDTLAMLGYTNLSVGAEVSKLGHFVVFLIIGLIVGANSRKIGLIFSLAAIAAFALLTEALQQLVVDRTTSINDFLIDLCAGAIGLFFGVIILLLYSRFHSKHRESC